MLSFQYNGKTYFGVSAMDIVRALETDEVGYPHRGNSVRQFLAWSLEELYRRLPPRDLELSDRLSDDDLALSYLCLRDEYGVGELSGFARNGEKSETVGQSPLQRRGR